MRFRTSKSAVNDTVYDDPGAQAVPATGDTLAKRLFLFYGTASLVSRVFVCPECVTLCLALQASRVWVQNKVDESKHEIHSQVDAITAGTASVVNLTAGKSLSDLWCAVVLCRKESYSFIEITDFHMGRVSF